MGWFSKIENPLVRDLSIACWRLFSDLDLSEAKKSEFKSLHDCFTRELKAGPAAARSLIRNCGEPGDGIVGAFGRIADTELFQVKGAPYSLLDLLGDPRARGPAPQWKLCHPAADVEHVSPLPRAA